MTTNTRAEDDVYSSSFEALPESLEPDFRSTPLWTDDRPHDEHTDSREGTAVFDLYTSGHGFTIRRRPPTADPRFRCKRCGTSILRPAPSWECEFDGPVTQRPAFTGYHRDRRRTVECACIACLYSVDTRTGRPPARCEPCRRSKEQERAQAHRDARKARDRDQAAAALRLDSSRGDKDVATELGIPIVRVTEARELVRTGN